MSPSSYTPRHLADKILTSRAAVEGERKLVTVLFVDVSGFTGLSERLDPEEVHHLMNDAFEMMLAEVHHHEGTVNQFLGDGIMALFGAPIAHEDHAKRAAGAALGIQKRLGGLGEELGRRGIRFQVRQGLNTGLVVVGSIGTDLRMDYTAVGDVTNVANRLMQVAEPEQIMISESTHRLVGDYFASADLGVRSLKGKDAPVRVWALQSGRVARTRIEVEEERGLTPFVGRAYELQTLLGCFEKARAGRGQVVFVVGEPGIGKSRLLLEMRRRLSPDVTWVEGHAGPLSVSTAYHPLVDLLRRCLHVEETGSEDALRQRIEENVRALGEDLLPIVPYLLYLLSGSASAASALPADLKRRREGLFDAIRRFLARIAQPQPMVIVYEDVHWMDKATEEILLEINDIIATGRILQIFTHRSGYVHPFGDHTYHTRISLDALSDEDSIHMAEAMLATASLPGELERLIVDGADGNPFFVEEIVRSLCEQDVVRPGPHLQLRADRLDHIVVPDTVQDLITARIDRLTDTQKRVLQVAAVIGREFSSRLVARVADIGEGTDTALRELERLELLNEKGLFPEVVYVFRHSLTQEVTYNSLLLQRRRTLHQTIGEAIEDVYADRLPERSEVLAYHFSHSEEADKAIQYLVLSGDKAALSFANREARAFYEEAAALAASRDRTRHADVQRKLATITQYLGDADASLRHAEMAVALYDKLGDRKSVVALHLHIHALYMWQWDGAREDMGLKHLETAAALVEPEPDSVEKGLVYQRIGHGYLHRSEPATALAWARRAVEMFERLKVTMGTSLGTALAYTGSVDEGFEYSAGNWEQVRKGGIPVVLAVFGHDMSLTLALARDVARARDWAERVLPDVMRASPVFEVMIRRPLALIHTLAGDLDKAAEMVRVIERIEAQLRLGCVYEDGAAVGLYYLRRGELDKAQSYLDRGVQLYSDRRNLSALAGCTLMLGWVHLEGGRLEEAQRLLVESLGMSRRGGNALIQLWILPILAQACLSAGRIDEAEQHVDAAFELLRPSLEGRGLAGPLQLAAGMLAGSRRDLKRADRHFERAAEISRRHALPWDEAKALCEWASVAWAGGSQTAGERETAHQRLTASAAIFDRIGARLDAERARIKRAELDAR